MKKFFLILICLILSFNSIIGQTVINSQYKPLSFDVMVMAAQAQAYQDEINKEEFDKYKDLAYKALDHGDKSQFITYSNYALSTGWYNAKIYYDRGKVFQSFGDYKNAKREFKKAKRKGYYQASQALEDLKRIKKSRKR
jgi:hypothetical protein